MFSHCNFLVSLFCIIVKTDMGRAGEEETQGEWERMSVRTSAPMEGRRAWNKQLEAPFQS